MQFVHYTVNIHDIIPQQHYLSRPKLITARQSLTEYESYGDIYVILYRQRMFSVDGHHRLYLLHQDGVQTVNVLNEVADNDHRLYQLLADEALELGLTTIADLSSRILETDAAFQEKWVGKCQRMLKAMAAKTGG